MFLLVLVNIPITLLNGVNFKIDEYSRHKVA